MPIVTLFFDVEDPLAPDSDDAALRVCQLLAAEGLTATMCVTGEKARKLRERARRDVIEALKSHSLGLHTNTHSVHPTTMEAVEDLSWEQGVEAIRKSEEPGLASFEEVFGRMPCCWAGAGNTWAPHVLGWLVTTPIKAWAYSLLTPPGGEPHRVNGLCGFPQHGAISEDDYASPESRVTALDRIRALCSSKLEWVGVFLGHPTRYVHRAFWDAAYYGGLNPTGEIPLPEERPQAEREALFEGLEELLPKIAELGPVLPLDEVLALPWDWVPMGAGAMRHTREAATKRIAQAAKWPIHRPHLRVESLLAPLEAALGGLEIGRLRR